MKFLCRVGLHAWGQFKFLYPIDIMGEYSKHPVRTVRLYEAHCTECGNVRTKRLKG